MPTRHGMHGDPSDIRRASPVAFLLLTEQMVRQARTARAAAVGDALVRGFAAAMRGVRLLSSTALTANAFRALRTAGATLWSWRQQRRAASELHSLSDQSLRDIGIARSYIDEQVRLAAKRYARSRNSTGLT